MKRKWIILWTVLGGVGGLGVLAEVGLDKSEALAKKLELGLRRFPDSDLNQDGKLTIDEALSYLQKHPELRQQLDLTQILNEPRPVRSSYKPANYLPEETGPRVFVCGHSYMIFTAGLLPGLSKSAEVPYRNAGQQMIGGSRVHQHWQLPEDRNEAKRSLEKGIVDLLILSPALELPDEGIEHFARLGFSKNRDIRILVQASWAPRDGKMFGKFLNQQRDAVTVEELRQMRRFQREHWLKSLEQQVDELNAQLDPNRRVIGIVPVFDAVYALREKVVQGEAPGIKWQSELFKDDHGHPNPVLALLVSYCHFAAIHQRSPMGIPTHPSIRSLPQAEPLNQLLQQLAWDAVSQYPASGVEPTAKLQQQTPHPTREAIQDS